ncbi:MAG: MBOAT family O-acyltransferase [Pseudomonadales bacterium]
MLFNSLQYFIFFILVLVGARLLQDKAGFSWRTLFLLVASYVFYISNNGWLVLLILASTGVDFLAGRCIDQARSSKLKKVALVSSVVVNLSILGYYKYIDFLRESISAVALGWGFELSWVDLNVVLPVGISFYTFQSMSYTIDVYRGEIPAERSFLKFAFYVAYFPQLIAGPIMRASYFMPQIERAHRLELKDVEQGVFLIMRGLFKKIVLADFLALYADVAFSLGDEVSSTDLLIGLYAFTLQIYFDFSGYTDIAIGSSRLLGYRIPDNFNRPYAATGFSDFWQRWHISLSSWLRDYLYISLGGNRRGTIFTYRNLMLTMLLGGLWHGAGWQFIVWGLMHGVYLIAERFAGWADRKPVALYDKLLRRLIIFHCIALTWIPFRSASLEDAYEYVVRLLAFEGSLEVSRGMAAVLVVTVAALALQWLCDLKSELRERVSSLLLNQAYQRKMALYGGLAIVIVIANAGGAQPFIYFQF